MKMQVKENVKKSVRELTTFGCALLIGSAALAADTTETPARRLSNETAEQKAERLSWWTHDRFGMFIHFGLYALRAKGEWAKMTECIPEDRYEDYFRQFNPKHLDVRAWARAAKAAGMKYIVLTAKHHDGFCLWDTKHTDYKVTKTSYGRDLIREYADACRAEGLRVGLYYSLIDWHHPDFTIDIYHPRRPKTAKTWEFYGDSDADYPELNKGRDMAKYRQYMKDQVAELLTNYGRIDIIWYDYTYDKENGKSAKDWDSEGLLALTRRLQPGIIVNNRLGLDDTEDGWDFVTPEQFKVEKWPTVRGERVAWEACQTFSGSWGYNRDQTTWKDTSELVYLLVQTVSKGGNLIMNVGPTGQGAFDARAQARLDGYARWMQFNSDSVYGCTEAPERFKAPEGTLLTYNPKAGRLYIHLVAYHGGDLAVDFGDEIAYAQFLHDASEVAISKPKPWHQQSFYKHGGEDKTRLALPAIKPDGDLPVIEVVLKN